MRYLALLALIVMGCTDEGPGGKNNNGNGNGNGDGPNPTDPTDPPDTFPTVEPPQLVINEVMAGNDSTINGTDGYTTPDYIEIVNLDDEDIPLSRIEIEGEEGTWVGPADRVIAAGERLLIQADVTADDGGAGLWTGFVLDKDEDEITLFADGYPVDEVEIEGLVDDVAFARTPDLTGDFVATAWPTPGEVNEETASPTLIPSDETVFTPGVVHQIYFTMTENAYDKINESSRPEVHVEATIDGIKYQDVGLKLKGSASYQTMDAKPAFVLDLNAWVLGTKFRGQRAVGLHNGAVVDPTRTRDFLTYQLAREAGLLAPRVSWAEIYVNDNYYGIYMWIERYEEEFVEYRRPGDGELGMVFEGNETQTGDWASDFGDAPDANFDMEEGPIPPPVEALTAINMVNDIVAGSATDAKVAELWNYVNKDQFLTYMAWESVVMHTDGYRSPNNWRFYVDPHTYKLEWAASGAEWTWDFDTDVFSSGGNVSNFCLQNTQCKHDYAEKVLIVADLADSLDLLTQFEDLSAWLDPLIDADPRYNGWYDIDDQRASTHEHLQRNPQDARNQVYQTFPDLMP